MVHSSAYSLSCLTVLLLLIQLVVSMDITKSLDSVSPSGSPQNPQSGDTPDPVAPVAQIPEGPESPTESPTAEDDTRSEIGFGLFPGFNTLNTGTGTGTGYSTFGQTCPMQTNILDSARLSDDPTGYPVDEIAAELALRPQFAAFLVDQAVLPGTDPTIPEDPRFLTANMTCPFIRKQLWSFFKNNGICWVLQNFQEQILFADCIVKQCQFCQNPFGFNTQNQCLKQYELTSAYVYCPSIQFPRIINERIILPRYCTCKVVNCDTTSHHNPFSGFEHMFNTLAFGKK